MFWMHMGQTAKQWKISLRCHLRLISLLPCCICCNISSQLGKACEIFLGAAQPLQHGLARPNATDWPHDFFFVRDVAACREQHKKSPGLCNQSPTTSTRTRTRTRTTTTTPNDKQETINQQTNKQTNKQTSKQASKQANKQTNKETKQTNKQTNKQRSKTNKETKQQRNKDTKKDTKKKPTKTKQTKEQKQQPQPPLYKCLTSYVGRMISGCGVLPDFPSHRTAFAWINWILVTGPVTIAVAEVFLVILIFIVLPDNEQKFEDDNNQAKLSGQTVPNDSSQTFQNSWSNVWPF